MASRATEAAEGKASWQSGDTQQAAEPRRQPTARRGKGGANRGSIELGCCASSLARGHQGKGSVCLGSDNSPRVTPRRAGLQKGSIEGNDSTPRTARCTCAPHAESRVTLLEGQGRLPRGDLRTRARAPGGGENGLVLRAEREGWAASLPGASLPSEVQPLVCSSPAQGWSQGAESVRVKGQGCG